MIATASGGFAETVEDTVSGFLVPNGDIKTLASRMAAIAARQSFPDHRVPSEVVERVAERHDNILHTTRVRAVLQDAVLESRSSLT